MIINGIERLRPVLADSASSVTFTSNAIISATATESTKITGEHETLSAAASRATDEDRNVNCDDFALRVLTPSTAISTREACGWSRTVSLAANTAVAYVASAYTRAYVGEDQGGQDEGMMDEYDFQWLIDDLGDMEPQVGRFGPDWEGDDSDNS